MCRVFSADWARGVIPLRRKGLVLGFSPSGGLIGVAAATLISKTVDSGLVWPVAFCDCSLVSRTSPPGVTRVTCGAETPINAA